MHRRGRWVVAIAVRSLALLGLVSLLAACSEDRSASGSTSTTASAGATDCRSDLVACTKRSSLGDLVDDGSIPSRRTAATGEPIVLGMINQENTPAGSYPELSSAVQAGVRYVDEQLGGVHGRPIRVDVCNTGFSPEGSTACAQRFVQAGVPAVLGGIDVFGTGIDTLADNGIPYVGGIPVSSASATSPASYQWSGGTWGATVAFAHDAATRGRAKRVAIVYPEFGPITNSAGYGRTTLEHAGVHDVQMVPYPITATDLTSPLQAAASSHPDALIVLAADTGCKGAFDGVQTVGITAQVYLVGACAAPKIVDEAGPERTDGTILNVEGPVDRSAANVDFDLYTSVAATYGDGFDPVGAGTVSFRSFLNLYRVLVGIEGEPTAAAVRAGLEAQRGTPSFMGHPSTCDHHQIAGLPAMCSPQQILAELHGGQLTQLGTWIDVGAAYGDG